MVQQAYVVHGFLGFTMDDKTVAGAYNQQPPGFSDFDLASRLNSVSRARQHSSCGEASPAWAVVIAIGRAGASVWLAQRQAPKMKTHPER